jgi:hypothetical protein
MSPRWNRAVAIAWLALLGAVSCGVDARDPEVASAMQSERPAQPFAPGAQPDGAMSLGSSMAVSPCSGPDCASAPRELSGGAASASCSLDERACSNSGLEIPTRCTAAGVWEDQTACAAPTPLCFRGACVECAPGSVRCSGEGASVPQVCSPEATWRSGAACSGDAPKCLDGLCVNVGAMCSSNAECATDACLNGACVECMPQSRACVDDTPRSCSELGSWVNGSPCSGALPRCRADTGECALAEWSRQFGTAGYDVLVGMAADTAGNVYLTGDVYEAALPGQIALGASDAYVRKYDGAGNELWTVQYGTDGDDVGTSLALDASGNVVAMAPTLAASLIGSGSTRSGLLRRYSGATGAELFRTQYFYQGDYHWMALDPSGNILLGIDNFPDTVVKLDANANEQWVRELPDGTDVYAVGSDSQDNVLVVGGLGTNTVQAFVRKYSPGGSELWTRQFGANITRAYSVASDGSGNLLVAGTTDDSLAPDDSTTPPGSFVRKFDAEGVELWTRQINGAVAGGQNAVSVDAAGNVYLAAEVSSPFDDQIRAGDTQALLLKFAADGTQLSQRTFGSSMQEHVTGVALSATGMAFVAGATAGTLPGQRGNGDGDVFVVLLQP